MSHVRLNLGDVLGVCERGAVAPDVVRLLVEELAALRVVAETSKELQAHLGPTSLRCAECGKHTDDLVTVNRHSRGECSACIETYTGADFSRSLLDLRAALKDARYE